MPSGSPQAMFPPPTRRRILLIGGSLLVTTGLMASCVGEGGSGTPTATTPSIGLTSEPTPSSALPRELQGSVVVHFRSADGVDLEGRMFGTGTVGVVLAHIADPQQAQAEWFPFAPVLVHHGYRVLTFDFRGFCPGDLAGCSATGDRTKIWLDVVAACDFLRSKRVSEVFAVGAGLGGHAALFAASRPGVDLAGVVELGAPQRALLGPMSYDITRTVLRQIREPKLFMAGKGAVESGYDPTADARSMYRSSVRPKELVVVSSPLPGNTLLLEPRARSVLLRFLAEYR